MAETLPLERVKTPAPVAEHTPAVRDTGMFAMIERAARDTSVDVDKLERLIALKERADAKDAARQFSEAMNAAQSEMRPIAADATNPQTKSKYASYPALDRALRPIYTKHGFSLSFDTGDAPASDMVRGLCYVDHTGGHSRTYKVDIAADGKGAKGNDVMTRTHATGAALTYAQRYLLKLIFNIAVGADDDGNSAGGNDGLINDDQAQTIFDMIKRANADTAKVCKFLGVESIPDMKAKDFEKAVIAINEYERSKIRK